MAQPNAPIREVVFEEQANSSRRKEQVVSRGLQGGEKLGAVRVPVTERLPAIVAFPVTPNVPPTLALPVVVEFPPVAELPRVVRLVSTSRPPSTCTLAPSGSCNETLEILPVNAMEPIKPSICW